MMTVIRTALRTGFIPERYLAVAFRELEEASDGTPHAVVRRRAGFLQGACQIAFLYGISNALCEMPYKNIRWHLRREINYGYDKNPPPAIYLPRIR